MLAFLSDFGVNVAANIVVALLLGVVTVAYVRRNRREGVLEFFGFEPGRSEMTILLSSIAVRARGTEGTSEIVEGFHGDAITEIEYRHALSLTDAIERRSGSWLVSTILGARAGADPIRPQIKQSKSFADDIDPDTREVRYKSKEIEARLRATPCTVIIGAPIYNLEAHYLNQEHCNRGPGSCWFEFMREDDPAGPRRGIRSHIGGEPNDYWRSEEPDGAVEDYFILEKITIGTSKIFLCAGTCTAATAAAVNALSEWQALAEEYGPRDFSRLYRWTSVTGRHKAVERRESDPSAGESKYMFDSRGDPP